MLKMDARPQFGDNLKLLEDAKETCLSSASPDGNCHRKMQSALKSTQLLFDQVIDEYKLKYAMMIPNRPAQTPPM
jgi:hypothetical protein